MKIVILWAGMGRRIQQHYAGMHKALIPFNSFPLMWYYMLNFQKCQIDEFIPILGYQSDILLELLLENALGMKITPVIVCKYDETGNAYSLFQAKSLIDGEEFIVINGDMAFDYRILRELMSVEGSAIAIDDSNRDELIDSPMVMLNNGKVIDVGRHINRKVGAGYAVGMYKFSREASRDYFAKAMEMITVDPKIGYQDPLREILLQDTFSIVSTGGYLWSDIDELEDVPKIQKIIDSLY